MKENQVDDIPKIVNVMSILRALINTPTLPTIDISPK